MNTRNLWTRTMAIAPLAALLTVTGCGGDGIDNSQPQPDAVGTTVSSGTADAQLAMSPAPSNAATPAVASPGAITTPGGALPPDIDVSVPDTLALPGESVEITVEGTQDVVEVALWDGLEDRQAFTREASSGLWQATYRVPLRPRSDRVALSVTARNEAGRWRRRWVFLNVEEQGCSDEPADSTQVGATGSTAQ